MRDSATSRTAETLHKNVTDYVLNLYFPFISISPLRSLLNRLSCISFAEFKQLGKTPLLRICDTFTVKFPPWGFLKDTRQGITVGASRALRYNPRAKGLNLIELIIVSHRL